MGIATFRNVVRSTSYRRREQAMDVTAPASMHHHGCDPYCPALQGQRTSRCSRAMAAANADQAPLNRAVGRLGFLRALGMVVGATALGDAAGPLSAMFSPVAGALAAGKAKVTATGAGLWLGNARSLTPAQALTYTDPGSGDPALLMRLANGRYVSYDAGCTHGTCTVAYDPARHLMICPCHGATFDPARGARVLVGPAKDPLYQLPVRVDASGDVYYLAAPPGPKVNRLKTAPPYKGQTGDDGGGGDGGDGGDGNRSAGRGGNTGNNRIRRLRPSTAAQGLAPRPHRAKAQRDS
jgi:Rieske Fe-S protein